MNMRAVHWLLPLLILLVGAPVVQAQDPCLALQRSFAEEDYAPGAVLEVSLLIEGDCAEIIRALGIQETLPEGWVFKGVQTPTQLERIARALFNEFYQLDE